MHLAKELQGAGFVIVGAGFFGLTCAERIAKVLDQKVVVLEKRRHIGGNAWSEFDEGTGIEVHKYGSHLFHTSNRRVFEYISQFSQFNSYRHKVISKVGNTYYPMPINLLTLSSFFGLDFSPDSAREFLATKIVGEDSLDSFESRALRSIGPELYEAFIQGYTEKQWQTDPKLLPSEIFSRLPIRFDFNSDYFDDSFQGLPLNGYPQLFKNMSNSSKVQIITNIDYFDIKHLIRSDALTIYSGPIDRYFNYSEGHLGWRTLDFDIQTIGVKDFQGSAVINYPGKDVSFTRIHEFKHLHPERKEEMQNPSTIISKEYSRVAKLTDEPYYPINTSSDREKIITYRKMAAATKDIIFGGRLGSYQYLDMHMAIASALNCFESEITDWWKQHKV